MPLNRRSDNSRPASVLPNGNLLRVPRWRRRFETVVVPFGGGVEFDLRGIEIQSGNILAERRALEGDEGSVIIGPEQEGHASLQAPHVGPGFARERSGREAMIRISADREGRKEVLSRIPPRDRMCRRKLSVDIRAIGMAADDPVESGALNCVEDVSTPGRSLLGHLAKASGCTIGVELSRGKWRENVPRSARREEWRNGSPVSTSAADGCLKAVDKSHVIIKIIQLNQLKSTTTQNIHHAEN